jgi:hypothetical protein
MEGTALERRISRNESLGREPRLPWRSLDSIQLMRFISNPGIRPIYGQYGLRVQDIFEIFLDTAGQFFPQTSSIIDSIIILIF